ncbi:MAG: hypothetical protein ACXWC9_02055 [Pseudobdellovibrionaceae bacterium]
MNIKKEIRKEIRKKLRIKSRTGSCKWMLPALANKLADRPIYWPRREARIFLLSPAPFFSGHDGQKT